MYSIIVQNDTQYKNTLHQDTQLVICRICFHERTIVYHHDNLSIVGRCTRLWTARRSCKAAAPSNTGPGRSALRCVRAKRPNHAQRRANVRSGRRWLPALLVDCTSKCNLLGAPAFVRILCAYSKSYIITFTAREHSPNPLPPTHFA